MARRRRRDVETKVVLAADLQEGDVIIGTKGDGSVKRTPVGRVERRSEGFPKGLVLPQIADKPDLQMHYTADERVVIER